MIYIAKKKLFAMNLKRLRTYRLFFLYRFPFQSITNEVYDFYVLMQLIKISLFQVIEKSHQRSKPTFF